MHKVSPVATRYETISRVVAMRVGLISSSVEPQCDALLLVFARTGAAMRKWNVADPHFIGYTYKNWEAVHSGSEGPPELAAVQLRKKTPARPTLQQLQSNLQAMGISAEQQQSQQ